MEKNDKELETSINIDEPKKRKPGRPKKITIDDTALSKTTPVEPKKQKSTKNSSFEKSIEETINQLVDENLSTEYLISSNVKKAIEPLEIQLENFTNLSDTEKPNVILKSIEKLNRDLQKRVESVEKECREKNQTLKKIKRICQELKDERSLTRQLIHIEQDYLAENERRLAQQYSEKIAPTFDIPDFFKSIFHLLGGKRDEITLQTSIKKSEVKISTRDRSLVAINGELSNYIVVLTYRDDELQNLNQITNALRLLRMEVGKDTRKLREQIRDESISKYQDQYLTKFQSLVFSIDRISDSFYSAVESTKKSLSNSHKSIKELQSQAVNVKTDEPTGTLLSRLSTELDSKINQFFNNTQN